MNRFNGSLSSRAQLWGAFVCLLLTAMTTIACIRATFIVIKTAEEINVIAGKWNHLAEQVESADIRVCANRLPPMMQRSKLKFPASSNSEITPPAPDPQPCGETQESHY